MKFTLLHTNDIHSNFTNLAKIKTIIDRQMNRTILILDAGDFVDFKRIEYLGTNGMLAGDILKACHYDAIAIGNNETFQGINMLEQMALNSKTPFLSCNLEKKSGLLEGIKKYTIVNKEGVRFLIIGITTGLDGLLTLLDFTLKDHVSGIQAILEREKENYDISIILSHLGTKLDQLLIEKMNDIDILISAHDHVLYDKAKKIHNTVNCSVGYMGEAIGVLEFDYTNKLLTLENSNIVKTSNEIESETILQLIKNNKAIAIENLSKPLFTIEENLFHDYIEESPIANLLADAIKDLLKTDIGVINSGIVNGGVMKGGVSEKKLIDICPSPLNPTYIELQGKDLLHALELSLDTDICLNPGKGPGFRGICCGALNVSGLKIYYENTKIEKVLINDEDLDIDKWYKIATSDYLQRGTVYESFKNNRYFQYDAQYFRDTLRTYLNKKEFVQNALNKRWIKNT